MIKITSEQCEKFSIKKLFTPISEGGQRWHLVGITHSNEKSNVGLLRLGSGTRKLTKGDLMTYDTVMGKKAWGHKWGH